MPTQALVPGDYTLRLSLEVGVEAVDMIEDALTTTIHPSDYYGTGHAPFRGLIALPQSWSMHDGTPDGDEGFPTWIETAHLLHRAS
jgi:hypothetical protein